MLRKITALLSVLTTCISSASFENHESIDNIFPVTDEQQNKIYEDYLEIIQKVQNGNDTGFIEAPLDPENLRNYNKARSENIIIIDIGGSKLKLCNAIIETCNDNTGSKSCKVSIPEVYTEEYLPFSKEKLENTNWYDWAVEAIQKHSEDLALNEKTKAALTFSYPVNQEGLADAKIKNICKNWNFKKTAEIFKENIVEKLNEALRNKNINLSVNCVLNDAIATFCSGLIKHRTKSVIGFIIGTGMNASYEIAMKEGKRIFNSEMAQTQIDKELLTVADNAVIEKLNSENRPYNTLEVITAGYKFVEIVKEALARIVFENDEDNKSKVNSMSLDQILELASDVSQEKDIDELSSKIQKTILAFKTRAAKISAALLAAIIKNQLNKEVLLVLNGSVLKNKLDQDLLSSYLKEFLKRKKIHTGFEMEFMSEGSLSGAGYVSLVMQ